MFIEKRKKSNYTKRLTFSLHFQPTVFINKVRFSYATLKNFNRKLVYSDTCV